MIPHGRPVQAGRPECAYHSRIWVNGAKDRHGWENGFLLLRAAAH